MLRLRLRLRCCVVSHLLSSPSAPPIPFRLLSTAVSPSPGFSVEEYLVETCGLTRAQATKASAKLSHLKSPAKPDAVLALLAGLGLSGADIAALVARDPQFLCAKVDKTLAPKVAGLTGLGLLPSEIGRIAFLAGDKFRRRNIVSKLQYYFPLFGSPDNLLRVLKKNSYLLTSDLEGVVKPNVTLLLECGLGACDISKVCIAQPWLLTTKPERVQAMVACAENIGVPRGSGMFRHALNAIAFRSEEKITAKVEHLKNTFRWSDVEVGIAVSRSPPVLTRSKDRLQHVSEFLTNEAGLEPTYIAHWSVMLTYSLEGRLRPRYYVVKFLKENGLLKRDRDYCSAVMLVEKVFMEKFICPHKVAAPHLAEDYAAACRGEVPARFIFA